VSRGYHRDIVFSRHGIPEVSMDLLAIREEWSPQGELGYMIEEVETGRFFDFANGQLADHPTEMISRLKERWKDHDHGDDGKPDPALGDVRPLRGCYANADANNPERAVLDVSQLPHGRYKIYITDLEAHGNVIRIYDWDNTERPNPPSANQPGAGTSLNIQLPQELKLTVDVPALGTINLVSPAAAPTAQPAEGVATQASPQPPQAAVEVAQTQAPAKPAPAAATPSRKPSAPASNRGRSRK
jgi:hypothetical protein